MFSGFAKQVLLAVCWVALGATLRAAPNVLVLVSYHPGYSWSDGELQGVLRVVNRTHPGAIPSVEFLDANRTKDAAQAENFSAFILQKYRAQSLDVIVTLDDAALQFVLRHRAELGAHIPVVFGGVNDYRPEMLEGFTEVTGVSESFDFTGNIDLILRLRPGARTIHIISDTAQSTVATRAALGRVLGRYTGRVEFKHLTDWTAASLLQRLAALPPEDAALIVGNARDANGQLVSEDEQFLKGEAASSTVPIFMITQPYLPIREGYSWERAVWYGMGGRMTTSDIHGEAVGALLVRVLSGEKASAIPVVRVSPTRCAFNYPQLLRHRIDLSRLPADAELFERPISFFEQYRARILVTLSIMALLLAAVVVLAGNILKRKRAERALRTAVDRFELVARATNDAVWDLDPTAGTLWWNDGYKALLGLRPDEKPGRAAWEAAIHSDDRAAVLERLFAPSAGATSSETLEHRIVRPDGGIREVLLRAYFLRDAGGKLVRAIGSMLDLTHHKATERQLLMLATAVMQATDIVVVLDGDGRVEYANPAFARSTGRTVASALRRPLTLFQNARGEPLPLEHVARIVAAEGRWTERLSLPRPDGDPVRIQVTVSAIRNVSGAHSGFLMMGRDVTNEVRLEEQVRLSQKMDAIGTLAGGVAHDFNNMVQVISGNVSLAMDDGSTREQIQENLNSIREAAQRATQLTRQLMLFGRRQPPQAEAVDLRELTEEMLRLLRRLIGENFVVGQTAEADLWEAHADKGQVEQVLMNLCVNARDAMPNGGRLDVSLRNVRFDAAFCEKHAWARPGEYPSLTVSDTGCGMEQATLERIFEPFFTTKTADKGTGLGLSVVFGIVEQHGGFLHVESAPGKGSRFEVFLPRAPRRGAKPAEKTEAAAARGSGTILLIEDEESVRAVMQRVLQSAGYRVIAAGDGAEGLQLGLSHLGELSLVVLDAVLPTLSGVGVYEKLAPMRPELPFIFCSGYGADVVPAAIAGLAQVRRLQKPFEVRKLLEEIGRHALRKTGRDAAGG